MELWIFITFQYFYACFPGEFVNVAQVGEPTEGGGKFQTCQHCGAGALNSLNRSHSCTFSLAGVPRGEEGSPAVQLRAHRP